MAAGHRTVAGADHMALPEADILVAVGHTADLVVDSPAGLDDVGCRRHSHLVLVAVRAGDRFRGDGHIRRLHTGFAEVGSRRCTAGLVVVGSRLGRRRRVGSCCRTGRTLLWYL